MAELGIEKIAKPAQDQLQVHLLSKLRDGDNIITELLIHYFNFAETIKPNEPVTVTYEVTVAPGVETPLVFSKTPTVQAYH